MANIVTRSLTTTTVTTTNLGKGTSLTHNELDSNFLNLNNDKIDNTNPDIFGNISLTGTTASTVGSLVLKEATDNGSHQIKIQPPTSLAANVTFTLPDTDGNANEVLITDGSGVLSWSATYAGDITEVTTTSPITGGGASGSINISFDPSAVRIDELANATANISLANGNYIFNGDGDEGIGFFADKLQLSNVELAGDLTMSSSSIDIGSSGVRVDNLYVNNLNASGTITGVGINDLSDVDTSGVATGSVLRYDGANWAVSNLIEETTEVSEDTTPQLGGDLDVNGNDIVSVSAGNVVIAPDSANSEGYSTATLDSGSGHFFLKSGLVLDHPGTAGLDAQYSNYITVATTDGDLNMSANGGGRIRPRSDFQIRGSDGCDLWLRSEFSTDAKISYRGGGTEEGYLVVDRNNSEVRYYTDSWDQKMVSTSGQVILEADSDEIQLNSSGSNVRATAQDIILQANDDIDFRAADRFQFRSKDSGTSEFNETMTLIQNNSGYTGTAATGAVVESSSDKQSGDYDTSLVIRKFDEGDGTNTAHSGISQRIASYDLTLEAGKSTLSLNYRDDDNTGAAQNSATLMKFKNSTSETATAGTQNAPDVMQLGVDLDVNGNDIISVSSNINLTPDGNVVVALDNTNEWYQEGSSRLYVNNTTFGSGIAVGDGQRSTPNDAGFGLDAMSFAYQFAGPQGGQMTQYLYSPASPLAAYGDNSDQKPLGVLKKFEWKDAGDWDVISYAATTASSNVVLSAKTLANAAGTATSTTLTTDSGFVSDDAGKTIVITGAGTAGADLTTTIASYTSATEVELTDAIVTTISGETATVSMEEFANAETGDFIRIEGAGPSTSTGMSGNLSVLITAVNDSSNIEIADIATNTGTYDAYLLKDDATALEWRAGAGYGKHYERHYATQYGSEYDTGNAESVGANDEGYVDYQLEAKRIYFKPQQNTATYLDLTGTQARMDSAQDIILNAGDDVDIRAADNFQFRNKDSSTGEFNETVTLIHQRSVTPQGTASGVVVESTDDKVGSDYATQLIIRRFDEGDGTNTAHSGVEQRIASYDLTLEAGKSTLSLNYVDDDNTGTQNNSTTLMKFKNSTSETATAGTQNAPDTIEFFKEIKATGSGGMVMGGNNFSDTARLYRNTTSHSSYSLEIASNSEATAIAAGQPGGAFGFTHQSDAFGNYYVGSINGVVGDEGTFGSAGENNNAIRLYTFSENAGAYPLNIVGEFRYASASFMKETLVFDNTSNVITIEAATANDDLTLKTSGSGDINVNPSGTGYIILSNLPTSSAGLPTGAVWNDSGTLKIA